jgi:hypothetical protein
VGNRTARRVIERGGIVRFQLGDAELAGRRHVPPARARCAPRRRVIVLVGQVRIGCCAGRDDT